MTPTGSGRRSWWITTVSATAVLAAGLSGAVHAGADPDVFTSPNVTFIRNIPLPTTGIGGKVLGNRFYLTSYVDVEIFDISNPADPQLLGKVPVNVERENEEVATNGQVLAVSSSMGCQYYTPGEPPAPADGRWEGTPVSCLELFDVRDPHNPTLLTHLMGAGQHTSTCVYDCQYIWGQYGGEVTDLTHIWDPGHPVKIVGNWIDNLPRLPVDCPGGNGDDPATHTCDLSKSQCHNVSEIAPGLMFAACQPLLLLSTRAADGGTVTHPKLLRYGLGGRGGFVHGVQWAQGGDDSFALVGGETNGTPLCDQGALPPAVLATWVRSGPNTIKEVGELALHDGTYTDGNPPAHTLGCSVHWFHLHPTFHNGGLVSLAAYDNGNRFVQVKPDGQLLDVGWFIRPNAATWASYWAPDQRTVYVVDDYRGFDVVRWNGSFYVPAAAGQNSAAAGPASGPAAVEAASVSSTPNTVAAGPAAGTASSIGALILGAFAVGRRRRRRRRELDA